MIACEECEEGFEPDFPGQVHCQDCGGEDDDLIEGDAIEVVTIQRPSLLDSDDPVERCRLSMELRAMSFGEPMADGLPDKELIVE